MKLFIKIMLAIVSIFTGYLIAPTYLFPFHFPTPTGPFGVGTQTHYLTSSRQQKLYSPDQSNGPRELVIQLWYPTPNKAFKPSAPWAPDFVAHLKKENFLYRFLSLDNILTSAQVSAPLAQQQALYPVILYSHGLGLGWRDDNTALCEELASHGYIVVGISHPYASYVVRLSDGREILNAIHTEHLPYKERQDLATQEMEIWLADSQAVISYLEMLNKKQSENIFFEALDLQKLGAMGHSFGGATATQLCRRDAWCKAGINMDGKLYGPEPTSPFYKPFMLLLASESLQDCKLSEKEILRKYQTKENYEESCKAHVQAFDELVNAMGKDGHKVVIDGAGHGAFSDFALLKYHSFLSRYFVDLDTGKLDGRKSHKMMTTSVLQFFNKHLKKESSYPF